MKEFAETTYIHDKPEKSKSSSRSEVDVSDLLKFIGCKISSTKLIQLKEIQEALPTAWGLNE